MKQTETRPPKAALTALGCKVSQVEAEAMAGLFQQRGYAIVPFSEMADVYVINTCSVTSLGERKSRQLIRRARRQNPQAIIAVTGCYAQVAPEEIQAMEGVRVILGTKDRARIVDAVEQAAREGGICREVGDILHAKTFEDIPLYGAPKRTRAFLKIQEGCANFCTYCIIPYARGPLRSRPLGSVREEARKLVDVMGFSEIVLTGIHLGAYGKDLAGGIALADAVESVLSLPKLRRLRLGSLESVELSPKLLRLLREEHRFAKHLHLPLQSGADSILRAMNRPYRAAQFAKLLADVERDVPGIAISTDVIVGFPGETEEDFRESLAFVSAMGFSRIHVFPYSRRQGTPAASFPGQVPAPVKRERVQRMQQLAAQKASQFHGRLIGKTEHVLFETIREGVADGLTGNYVRVYARADVRSGEMRAVRLDRLYRDGLWGELS